MRQRRGSRRRDGANAAAAIRAVLSGQAVERSIEYACTTPSGDKWFQLRVTPLTGLLDGALVCHVDVTRQRLASDELSRLIAVRQSMAAETEQSA